MVACYSIVAFWGYLCLAKRCIIWSKSYQETRTLWNQEDNNISKATITPIMPPLFLSQRTLLFIILDLLYWTLLYSLNGPQHIKIKKTPSNPNKNRLSHCFLYCTTSLAPIYAQEHPLDASRLYLHDDILRSAND